MISAINYTIKTNNNNKGRVFITKKRKTCSPTQFLMKLEHLRN